MSDSSQGPGWWQASDGKWYPPEQAPGAAPMPGTPGPPAAALDVGTALSYGWNKFTQYIGKVIIIVLVLVGVNVVFYVLRTSTSSLVLGAMFQLVGWIVSMIIQTRSPI